MLRLAEVDAGRLAELVTDAWRMRAPQALAVEMDEPGSVTGPLPAPSRSQVGRCHGHARRAVALVMRDVWRAVTMGAMRWLAHAARALVAA
jgi:hypothetical protein